VVNKCHLIGHLGRDPEVRYTTSGKSVAKFSLATSEGRSQEKESTAWHNIVVFGKAAEACRDYLKKGNRAYVEGKISYREFVSDRDGQKRTITEILADRVVFLTEPHGRHGRGEQQGPQEQPPREPEPLVPSDDDIPF